MGDCYGESVQGTPPRVQIRNIKPQTTIQMPKNVIDPITARINAQLSSDSNTVSPEVAAAALAEYTKMREDLQRAEMVRRLHNTTTNTTEAVEILRDARKNEKSAKTLLDAIAAAEAQYQKEGNWDAYSKSKTEAWNKFHNRS